MAASPGCDGLGSSRIICVLVIRNDHWLSGLALRLFCDARRGRQVICVRRGGHEDSSRGLACRKVWIACFLALTLVSFSFSPHEGSSWLKILPSHGSGGSRRFSARA